MKTVFDGDIYNWDNISLPLLDRGFRFADGLFETVAVVNENLRLLRWHLDRLAEGAGVLKLHAEEILIEERITSEIRLLKRLNGIEGDAKVRLYLFREAGGMYSPNSSGAHYLITIEKAELRKNVIIPIAGFAEKAVNYPTAYSRFKTLNALNFVVAGIEKKEHNWDEILISDIYGNISEALSSNIFWKRNGDYFTPPLSTGCVAGIMRRWVMEKLQKSGMAIMERTITPRELLEMESIFVTNSMGIRHIETIGDRQFVIDEEIAILAKELE